MLKTIRRFFSGNEDAPVTGRERHHLQVSVAVLLHEARRADYEEAEKESHAAELALMDLFGVEREEAAALLAEGRARAAELTSFYGPVSVIKREFGMPERIRLVEHLWRVSYADRKLNPYEDHYVRKIAHLLYLSNTECVLARNRARDSAPLWPL